MGFKLCQISVNISFIGEYPNNWHSFGVDCLVNDLKWILILEVSKFLFNGNYELFFIRMSL